MADIFLAVKPLLTIIAVLVCMIVVIKLLDSL